MPNFIGYLFLFGLVLFGLRGVEKQLKKLNENVVSGFASGEARFEKIEGNATDMKVQHAELVAVLKEKGVLDEKFGIV